MSDYNDSTIFDGQSGFTSGTFLRSVRQIVMAQDKHNDDQWAAQYAATRLDGQALQWYEDQDDDTQESWKILRRRIIQRWPPTQEVAAPGGDLAISSTIPTPAAAPPPIASPSSALPDVPGSGLNQASTPLPPVVSPDESEMAVYKLPQGLIRGRIRVQSLSGLSKGYITKSQNNLGYQKTSRIQSEILITTFKPSILYHTLEIEPLRGNRQYLAMAWVAQSASANAQRRTADWGCLVTATTDDDGETVSSITPKTAAHGLPPSLDIWHVLIDGNVLIAVEEKLQTRRSLTPILRNDGSIFFSNSLANFVATWKKEASRCEEVKLVFEPFV